MKEKLSSFYSERANQMLEQAYRDKEVNDEAEFDGNVKIEDVETKINSLKSRFNLAQMLSSTPDSVGVLEQPISIRISKTLQNIMDNISKKITSIFSKKDTQRIEQKEQEVQEGNLSWENGFDKPTNSTPDDKAQNEYKVKECTPMDKKVMRKTEQSVEQAPRQLDVSSNKKVDTKKKTAKL